AAVPTWRKPADRTERRPATRSKPSRRASRASRSPGAVPHPARRATLPARGRVKVGTGGSLFTRHRLCARLPGEVAFSLLVTPAKAGTQPSIRTTDAYCCLGADLRRHDGMS